MNDWLLVIIGLLLMLPFYAWVIARVTSSAYFASKKHFTRALVEDFGTSSRQGES